MTQEPEIAERAERAANLLPVLDLTWPDELQRMWFDCFIRCWAMANRASRKETP